MTFVKKITKALSFVAISSLCATAHSEISDGVIKIGFITDLSGVGADIDGPGGTEAIRMAIAEMGGAIEGKKIELLVVDHQNKADLAASKAREWFDQEGLDMLIGGSNSAANLAIARVARDKKKPFLAVGGGTSLLTNEQCSPYTVHWAYDTVALAKGTGAAVVRAGGKSWYFLTADYAFGTALEKDTSQVVKAAGGTVVGSIKHPLSASDFSSFVIQAQASKANILALANAGSDTINAIKAANDFGVTKSMTLAGLLIMITDIHSLGLKATQGMYLTDSWYWNYSQETQNWSRRFFAKTKRMPTSIQAADYSAALQYLQAVKATGSDDGEKTLAYLRKNKINDMFAKDGYIRDDGRMVHDMYLMQVKKPDESKEPWDYYKVVETIKGDAAFTTKAESKCSLWK
jgi:branched-chain amino acid transport system substrate-binding protein